MFLKPRGYYLEPNTEGVIALYNGTWDKSDNVIDRNRMIDVSIIANAKRNRMDSTAWTEDGKETILHFTTGSEGTYVAGVSTYAKNIEMDAKDFNEYLEHDGVLDMLQWREDNEALNEPAIEKYSKHVKTIFQVGEKWTTDWNVNLGYPIEFIPLTNPYKLEEGYDMKAILLRNGKPLPNQFVYLGTPQHHSHEHSDEPGLTHESNWATLSFEIGHGHLHDPAQNRKHLWMTLGGILLLSLIFIIYQRATS